MGLVYAAASEPNYKIKFNLHPDSIVTTPSINGMNHLISQRLRWSTKNYSSKDGGMKVALTIALSINVTNVLFVILTLFYPFLFPATLMMWVSKLTIDYLYLKSMSSFYHYGMPVGKYLFSLGAVNRQDVDNYAKNAKAAGGTVFAEPGESNGFMYGCGFCDPDGHRWNPVFMDLSKLPK